jgi:hypothetical protein
MLLTLAVLAGEDCERIRKSWLAQPANSVSSATFLIVGCWLLIRARKSEHPAALVTFAATMIGVGIGSIAYHGPQPGWADPVHHWAVLVLAAVFIAETIRLVAAHGMHRVVSAWKRPVGWIAAALLAYVLGRTGSPWCRPGSLWQPHAAWHVLSAVGLGRAATVRFMA